jgi:hypothetical protein
MSETGRQFLSAARGEEVGRLRGLRMALLRLHKILLDGERAEYERARGRVTGGELLQLVINHEQFAWLRAFSELIVRMDELLDLKEPAARADVSALFERARALVLPADDGGEHARKFAALGLDPAAVLARAEALKHLPEENRIEEN